MVLLVSASAIKVTLVTGHNNYNVLGKDFWEYTSDCDPNISETYGDNIDNNCNGIQDENNALSFDGVNDYVTISNESSFDFTNAMTVEAWIKVPLLQKIGMAMLRREISHGV
jgi:hypothetical protein